jgi:phospholipid/cholesterol/gamma-HCH transport system substrate-binding protein
MNRRIAPLGTALLIACSLIGAALFIYFSGRFGGPTLRLNRPYLISAVLPDSKNLADRSDVLDRGVPVGAVQALRLQGGVAHVTFSVDPRYAPIRRDAMIQVAEKTLLGEAFISLDPGQRDQPPLASGSTLPPSHVRPSSVEIDQALNALDPSARAHMKGLLRSTAAAAASPMTSQEIAQTLSSLPGLTGQLRLLGQELRGQEGYIAAGVINTRTVLGTLAERAQQVSTIVSGGRVTLQALASRSRALSLGLHRLPPLLATARHVLADVRPLLGDARPLLADLRTAAPPLTEAVRRLPAVTREADAVVSGLPSFNAAVVPFLGSVRPVLGLLHPDAIALGPALRNLVTVARYLSARKNTFAAWFANTAGIGASSDAKGHFVRFSIFMEPGTSYGTKGGWFENNPYTGPNDALHNQPYSGYPHLMAYYPGRPRR